METSAGSIILTVLAALLSVLITYAVSIRLSLYSVTYFFILVIVFVMMRIAFSPFVTLAEKLLASYNVKIKQSNTLNATSDFDFGICPSLEQGIDSDDIRTIFTGYNVSVPHVSYTSLPTVSNNSNASGVSASSPNASKAPTCPDRVLNKRLSYYNGEST